MAQFPDDLIRALGTVEIAGLLTLQLTNGLQSITLDQNRVTFPDPVFAVVPGFTQLGRGGKITSFHAAKLATEGILLHLFVPWARTLQYGDISH